MMLIVIGMRPQTELRCRKVGCRNKLAKILLSFPKEPIRMSQWMDSALLSTGSPMRTAFSPRFTKLQFKTNYTAKSR